MCWLMEVYLIRLVVFVLNCLLLWRRFLLQRRHRQRSYWLVKLLHQRLPIRTIVCHPSGCRNYTLTLARYLGIPMVWRWVQFVCLNLRLKTIQLNHWPLMLIVEVVVVLSPPFLQLRNIFKHHSSHFTDSLRFWFLTVIEWRVLSSLVVFLVKLRAWSVVLYILVVVLCRGSACLLGYCLSWRVDFTWTTSSWLLLWWRIIIVIDRSLIRTWLREIQTLAHRRGFVAGTAFMWLSGIACRRSWNSIATYTIPGLRVFQTAAALVRRTYIRLNDTDRLSLLWMTDGVWTSRLFFWSASSLDCTHSLLTRTVALACWLLSRGGADLGGELYRYSSRCAYSMILKLRGKLLSVIEILFFISNLIPILISWRQIRKLKLFGVGIKRAHKWLPVHNQLLCDGVATFNLLLAVVCESRVFVCYWSRVCERLSLLHRLS